MHCVTQHDKGQHMPRWLSIWQINLGTFSSFSAFSFCTGAIDQMATLPELLLPACKHNKPNHTLALCMRDVGVALRVRGQRL